MTVQYGACTTHETTCPVSVHVFEHGGTYYAFDVRNFAIFKLDRVGAQVLARMHAEPLDVIVEQLSPMVPAGWVRAHYLRFLEMLQDGTLSAAPPLRPTGTCFHRLVLLLAGGCNMGCLYCFEQSVPSYQAPNLLSQEKASAILDWFFLHLEGSKAHIQLYGGEPLLNWPVLQHTVEEVEKRATQRGVEWTQYLITNGTLLTAERIAWLVAHQVRIQVSIDGDTETHDRFRVFKTGQPTMERIKPGLAALASQGADYNLRAVMTRRNLDPGAVIDGLRSWGAEKVSFEVVATDNPQARLTETDWQSFNQGYRHFVQAPYKSWKLLPAEMQSMIIRICEQQRLFYGCGAGLSEVTVAPDGSILECQRMFRPPLGYIEDGKSPAELKSRFQTMVDDKAVCRDCWARYLCGGGCIHMAQLGHSRADPLPHYCTMIQTLAEASIVKIAEIRSQHRLPDGVVDDHRGAACIIEH